MDKEAKKAVKPISRRSFLKSTAAIGAMAAVYGCSKDSGSEIIYGGGITAQLMLKYLIQQK